MDQLRQSSSAERPASSPRERPARLAGVARIGRLSVVALDCRDPRALATFYSAITGWDIEDDDSGWVQLHSDSDVTLAFQLAPDHEPPVWPSVERPQQAHLDFDVNDLAPPRNRFLPWAPARRNRSPARASASSSTQQVIPFAWCSRADSA